MHSVDLSICYDGLTLSLDPSRYNLIESKGILLLTYNPLWKWVLPIEDFPARAMFD